MSVRILLSFLLLLVTSSIHAQKSYVTVTCNLHGDYAYLSGDIPSSMKTKYGHSDFPESNLSNGQGWIGLVLNLLAKEGFSVEQMNSTYQYVSEYYTDKSKLHTIFLLSKPSNNSTSNVIQRVQDDDSEVYEVARYNLQGIPINESEKGIQIIVYSNFTTKTIIKE